MKFIASRLAASFKIGLTASVSAISVGLSQDTKKSDTDVEDRRRSGDFIRCICGIYKDEGVMIQCEKCYVSLNMRKVLLCTNEIRPRSVDGVQYKH